MFENYGPLYTSSSLADFPYATRTGRRKRRQGRKTYIVKYILTFFPFHGKA